jgi:hypothetical protein
VLGRTDAASHGVALLLAQPANRPASTSPAAKVTKRLKLKEWGAVMVGMSGKNNVKWILHQIEEFSH